MKNGKKTENCRKNAGKKTEISKNGNGRICFSKFPSFFRFFFRFFYISGFFSGFFPFFKNAIRFLILNFRYKKDGQKTDKRRNFKILFSVFFPFFFRHFLKNPEKCRKKMVLFFSGNLRFVSVFGQKRNIMPDKIRKIPWGLNQDTATCGFFQNNFVFLEKKLKKTHKNRNPFFKNPKKFHQKKTGLRFFKNAKRNPVFSVSKTQSTSESPLTHWTN